MKDSERSITERIVAGETGKQTTIFSRPLKNIVFRPMWRVPDCIKAQGALAEPPGGEIIRQYELELRDEEWQAARLSHHRLAHDQHPRVRGGAAAGPEVRVGVVKFSFPSQHTIFMHDTVDKWMFQRRAHAQPRLPPPTQSGADGGDGPRRGQRLGRGEDRAYAAVLARQQVAIDKKIPMRIADFTQWVDDDGRAAGPIADIYGH